MYAFMYDSDEEHTVNMWQEMITCPPAGGYSVYTFQYGPPMCVATVGQPILWDTNNFNATTGGSSASVNTGPNTLTYQRQRTFTYPVTNVEDTACQVNTGFVYEDYEGRKHNLFLLNIMSVNNNGLGMDGQASCEIYYGIQPLLTGGRCSVQSGHCRGGSCRNTAR